MSSSRARIPRSAMVSQAYHERATCRARPRFLTGAGICRTAPIANTSIRAAPTARGFEGVRGLLGLAVANARPARPLRRAAGGRRHEQLGMVVGLANTAFARDRGLDDQKKLEHVARPALKQSLSLPRRFFLERGRRKNGEIDAA